MSEPDTIKPLVAPEEVLVLLQGYFGHAVRDLQRVEGGNVAQTYSFAVSEETDGEGPGAAAPREYIVRFNPPMPVNFEKEAYVYEHFDSPLVPVPRVVHVGRLGEVHYAISVKAPGRNLLQIPRDEYLALIPHLVEVLDAIHHAPVGDAQGYGIFDGSGAGRWPNWRSYLESVMEESESDFFGGWHALFETSFLERDLFNRLHSRMLQLAEHCPEERYLVHGDFGYSNVLAQDGRITAVLDWMSAMYGDFLYDVAWLDFWSAADGWGERFAEHYRSNGRATPHYAERVLCYQCFIALNSLKFYAKIGAKPSYDFAVERINSLLNAR